MAAISWGNRIRDYLIQEKGVQSAIATNYQTMINRITTAYPLLTENAELIAVLENLTDIMFDIAKEVYPLGFATSQADVLVWIQQTRPLLSPVAATLLSYVIATDLNTNIVPLASYPVKDDYLKAVWNAYAGIVRYMRHFATLFWTETDTNMAPGETKTTKFKANPLPNGTVVL